MHKLIMFHCNGMMSIVIASIHMMSTMHKH
jgi:hypothetical protein